VSTIDPAITDPTHPVGHWDGHRLVDADPELERAFTDLDFLALPSELWCAASKTVGDSLASGRSWTSLSWTERRAFTVALVRAIAHTVSSGTFEYQVYESPDAFAQRLLTVGTVAADLDLLTAALITAEERYANTDEVYVEATQQYERRQPHPPELPELLARGEQEWDDKYSLKLRRARAAALPKMSFEAALFTQDPLVVAEFTCEPSVQWIIEVWMKGDAVIDGAVVTEYQGDTAMAARWGGEGRWLRTEPVRIQRLPRDAAWKDWPPGAELVCAASDELFAALIDGDRSAAASAVKKLQLAWIGTPFRQPTLEYLASERWKWWDEPQKADPPAPPVRWETVRAIFAWHRVFAYWPCRALPIMGHLLEAGATPVAARTYAVIASSRAKVVTDRQLRIRCLLSPDQLGEVIAELITVGLMAGEDNTEFAAQLSTIEELKVVCRSFGLKVSGSKSELLERLAPVPSAMYRLGGERWADIHARPKFGGSPTDRYFVVAPLGYKLA
jgi:SAP domain.